MNQYQFIPFERASEFFTAVYGHKISPATISNAVNYLANRLGGLEKDIKDFLIAANLINCDETSANINGVKHWLHTVGTKEVAHYDIHKNRGKAATQEIGILPEFKGKMVHDHWKSYFSYTNAGHALCNAHHLRELLHLDENQHMKWAPKMSLLLVSIKENKEKQLSEGKNSFSNHFLNKYNSAYDEILEKARKEQARQGTIDSHNLIKRLKLFKNETLLFMNDFSVPFINNLSEQDLRMTKVKQKISGCFKNLKMVKIFAKLEILLITARKNGKNIFKTIQEAFNADMNLEKLLAT